MKKLIIGALMVAMSISLLAGCAKTTSTTKTGLGHSTVFSKATDATAEKDGLIQADTVMAAVTIDANGKIVSVAIDKVQPKAAFAIDGKAKTVAKTEEKSAVEKGDAYGMVKNGKAIAEWFTQMKSLETWMVGKTIAEVKAMKTMTKEASPGSVYVDEADLKTSVTVSVGDYIKAVEEAVANAK